MMTTAFERFSRLGLAFFVRRGRETVARRLSAQCQIKHFRAYTTTLDAMCSVCKVHCATWRTVVTNGGGYWTLDAFGQRWLVHHDDLLEAVVLLGEMLGVDWEDG